MFKKFSIQSYFILGLFLKVTLLFLIEPPTVFEWYHPFINQSLAESYYDPWKSWVENNGALEAFPYGYAMWIIFQPLTFLFKIFSLPTIFAYSLTILLADIILLLILNRLVPNREKLLLFSYWFSPVVILGTYGFGYNDLVPVLYLVGAVYCIKKLIFPIGGILLSAAVSAKLSMILALPLFVIYIFNNKSIRDKTVIFLGSFLLASIIILFPYLSSDYGSQMLFQNPEISKVFNLSLNLGEISLIIMPLLYFISLYLVWLFKRPNFDFFLSILAITFLFIVLINPGSPGWFIWSIPFLSIYQSKSGKIAMILTLIYSLLYLLSSLFLKSLYFYNGYELNVTNLLQNYNLYSSLTISLMHTSIIGLGIILAVKMCREAISLNNFYRLTRNPFVLGVAGDSGAGKDTYLDSIEDLFGRHSVVRISGDDYHLWDRGKPIWRNMTHLNPMANDLESFSNDLISLRDGKRIFKSHYNHDSGKLSKKYRLDPNDIIIAGGLHTFYLPILRECFNLKVFLDMDEKLRRHFKIIRDVNLRGHSIESVKDSFKKREIDSNKFIAPQANYADLIFALKPSNLLSIGELNNKEAISKFKLIVTTKHGFNESSLRRVLVGLCGLHVDINEDNSKDQTIMMVEGEISSYEIQMAAQILCPSLIEFLDISPKWQNGMIGVMQLVTLTHINQILSRKLI